MRLALLALAALLASCHPKPAHDPAAPAAPEAGALFRVGSIVIYQSDLQRELEDKRVASGDEAAKKRAIEELTARAQLAQAALDAHLDRDPAVRAQIARALAVRLKEQTLVPRLKEMSAPLPEPRLRELYTAAGARFQSPEKRQIAVLWLNPNGDPGRSAQYQQKLTAAREFLLASPDIKDHPEQGFSSLSVDHSEHAPSRYKSGIIGWLEPQSGGDPWTKAVAQIAYTLKDPGEVSPVITRPEGIFLVRYMALQPAVQRPFEAVRAELERVERQRMRTAAETEFDAAIRAKYPAQPLTP